MSSTLPSRRLATLLLLTSSLTASTLGQQITTRISVNSQGDQCDDWSVGPSPSQNGRYIAFYSYATDLVPGDTNGAPDIFVRDRLTGVTERVSVDSAGNQANGPSLFPFLTPDARFVSFTSWATNLVPGDTNKVADHFVHDRKTGVTVRVSVDSQGNEGNNPGTLDRFTTSALSADGRIVVFSSEASNLVPNDNNGKMDIFAHDLQTGETWRVSVSSLGEEGDDLSVYPSISSDGRIIAFSSHAANLVPGDTNAQPDIFVYEIATATTTRVSVSSQGDQADLGSSYSAVLTADGRLVAFNSSASNLVPNDTNGGTDEFVHDRLTGVTERVSVNSQGDEAAGFCQDVSISADGRFVAFTSDAPNLVPNDTNGEEDIFLHDRVTGKTTRMNVSSKGEQANEDSYHAAISPDGRYVAFRSEADNLVSGDTNDVLDIFLRGPELTLEADSVVLTDKQPLQLTIYKGPPDNPVALFVVAVNTTPMLALVVSTRFAPNGNFALWGDVPEGLAGNTITLRGFGIGEFDYGVPTNDLLLTFQ